MKDKKAGQGDCCPGPVLFCLWGFGGQLKQNLGLAECRSNGFLQGAHMKKALWLLALVVVVLVASPPKAQAVIAAAIDFQPVVNFSSPKKVVTCRIEFWDGTNPASIDIYTVGITEIGGLGLTEPIMAKPLSWSLGDHDNDGIKDLLVKFRRVQVAAAIGGPAEVILKVAGQLSDGTLFEGTDSIRTLNFYILQNSALLGGTLVMVLEFSVSGESYVVAKGTVGIAGNLLETNRPWKIAAALSAGIYRWTLDIPVPAGALPGSRVKALVELKTKNWPGGLPIWDTVNTKYGVELCCQP